MQKQKGGRKGAARSFRGVLAAVLSAAVLWGTGGAAVAASQPRMLIPVGRAVGIKLFSDGVLVVGLAEIPTDAGKAAPAKECGLKEGDIITHINSKEVDTIEQVQSLLQDLEGDKMSIRCLRGEQQLQMTVQAAKCTSDGTYKLGAWIRDSMAGIGTMTFYDPESKTFGALGHGINDVDTARLMPLQSGGIMAASVTDVKKGCKGSPGELHGAFSSLGDLGVLSANTDSGVFGTMEDTGWLKDTKPMEVAAACQVKVGPAVILSNVAGTATEEYTVEITKVYSDHDSDTRDMMLTVTDPRLLEITGGIVQGMSGSPIIQDGKLVGAVTHVLVNDPTTGYGIFIENMLDAAA